MVNPSTIDIINTKDGGATIDHLEIKYDVSKFGKINDKTVNFTIPIKEYLPENINITNELDKISGQIIIDKKVEKVFRVSANDIWITPKQGSLIYELKDSEIEFKVFGTEATLSKIKDPRDLNPHIDVSNLTDGEYALKLELRTNLHLELENIKVNIIIRRE